MSKKPKNPTFRVAVSVLILAAGLLAFLNRTGSLILFWKEEPLGSVTHDASYAYYAYVSDSNLTALSLPFYLREDDSFLDPGPLSVNEDRTVSIRESGGGAWQLLPNNDLYFSAGSGTPADHTYSIISPAIIRNRWLLVIFAACAAAAAANAVLYFRNRDAEPLRKIIRALTVLLFLLLLLPWNIQTFPAVPQPAGRMMLKPVLQRNAFFIGLLFIFLLALIRMNGAARFLNILAVVIVLLNAVWYFVPEWDYYGRRADSGAYLQHYSASSIRTPGYPLFIEGVYRLTGSDGLAELRAEDELSVSEQLLNGRTSDSRGLLNVVRAQKCVLGAAFLILFAVFSRYYAPLWFAFGAQLILCGGFLGADNSYVMTECLSQAAVLLVTAAFLLTVRGKKPAAFPVMCVFAALGILIRPADIFLVIPIALTVLIRLFGRRRMVGSTLIGCLLFVSIAAVPAVTIFREYRVFVWMPTSGYVEIARAVSLMEPGDEEAFSDPETRTFCRDLLSKKEDYPDADQNTYMWEVGVAVAEAHGYDRITCSPIFGKISRKIFMLHFREFAASLADTMRIALERTRLRFGPVPFAGLAAFFTILFLFRICTDSLTGMILMLMHIAHLCICVMNQPERRYIYSTEILCLLGWLLIITVLAAPRPHSEG